MRDSPTGYFDQDGVEIYEGDSFEWTLPCGFVNPSCPSLGALTEDCTNISKVIYINGHYILRGIRGDEGWACLLNGEIHRYKYGKIIGHVDIKHWPDGIYWLG